MKKLIPFIILTLALCSSFILFDPQDTPVESFDKAAIAVVNNFMNAINTNASDEMAAAKAAMPFIHKSEFENDGSNLKKDRLDFSFKKAWQNAKFYDAPVNITRIQKQNITAIGFGNTAQKGTAYKVFIKKKEGVAGLPAPLNVFIPEDGTEAKVYYYGSL
jgi:hypothetical protein